MKQGWDSAVFSCGRCGATRTAETETGYLAMVTGHQDAHAVWDRLNAIERAGMASILEVILSAPLVAAELLVLANREELNREQP